MDYETSNHSSSIIDESTVLVEGERGTKGRSLTLEEATDTILFCSSIIHNLAYDPATIAIEKETIPENNVFYHLFQLPRKVTRVKTRFKTEKQANNHQSCTKQWKTTPLKQLVITRIRVRKPIYQKPVLFILIIKRIRCRKSSNRNAIA